MVRMVRRMVLGRAATVVPKFVIARDCVELFRQQCIEHVSDASGGFVSREPGSSSHGATVSSRKGFLVVLQSVR